MKINPPVAVIALIFHLLENSYYGWNFYPQSEGELICDGISSIMFAMAVFIPEFTFMKVEKQS